MLNVAVMPKTYRSSKPTTATVPAVSLAHMNSPVKVQRRRAAYNGHIEYITPAASSLATAKVHCYARHSTRAGRRQQLNASAIPETAAGMTAVGQTSFAWSSYVSRRINLDLAIDEAVAGALRHREQQWGPELAIVFLSSAYVAEYGQLVQQLRAKIPSLKYIFGSTVSVWCYSCWHGILSDTSSCGSTEALCRCQYIPQSCLHIVNLKSRVFMGYLTACQVSKSW